MMFFVVIQLPTSFPESPERGIEMFNVRFEGFMAVRIKNALFWVMAPCGPC
jgi:hypothetical protein